MTEPIILYGCAPQPLIHYLKALGVLRLIAEHEHEPTDHDGHQRE